MKSSCYYSFVEMFKYFTKSDGYCHYSIESSDPFNSVVDSRLPHKLGHPQFIRASFGPHSGMRKDDERVA